MKKLLLPLMLMALMTAVPFGAQAQQGVQNYVSASGYVIYNAPFYNTGTDGYAFDFENDYVEGRLVDWTTIDADGDTHEWLLSPVGEGFGRNGSNGVMMSYSYSNYSGVLHPDNYLVSPKLSITANNHYVTFYGSALDESYPAEHFGLAVSTTTPTAAAFTMLNEWTMTAKQGNWHEYTVDLNAYVGQEVYIAIRHFNSSDVYALCIDDIFVGPQAKDPLTNCSIALDGATVANNVTGTHYLLNTNGFADGSTHTATVTATYQSGATLQKATTWTYRTGNHFQGSPSGLQAFSDGNSVTLSWDLPMMASSYTVDELFYDFADSTLSDLTLIDANNDGLNFRVYPYYGYGGGNCLKSDSWLGGGNAHALDPDNFIVTPQVTATDHTVFSFMAHDSDMPGAAPDPEHFGVAVSTSGNTDPADFTMIQEWNSVGSYTLYSVDLSAYAGQQIYVAIRHFHTTGDTYFLIVDNINLTGIEASITRPAKGAMVYANGELVARLNHGETSFTHMVNRYSSEYCIRVIQEGSKDNGTYYALAAPQCADAELICVAPEKLSTNWDGEKVTLNWERSFFIDFEDDPEGWAFPEADGDGNIFGIYMGGGMNPDGSINTSSNACLASLSYSNESGDLHPDNYAFMPLVKILPNAHIDFYAASLDPSYTGEPIAVVVASSDGQHIVDVQSFVTSYPYQFYTVDLSGYAGEEVFLGFHHRTTVSRYAVVVDNITVTNAVWVGTSSVTDHYNIYRSSDGSSYSLVGVADGEATSFDDNDIAAVHYYYKVTAVNTVAGGQHCESDPALSANGLHDYVQVTTDAVAEVEDGAQVYPNPTTGTLVVKAEGMTRVMVLNALGQVVYDAPVAADELTLDLGQYGAGMYLLRISTGDDTIVRRISVTK